MPGRFVFDDEQEATIKPSGRFVIEPTPDEAVATAEGVKADVLKGIGYTPGTATTTPPIMRPFREIITTKPGTLNYGMVPAIPRSPLPKGEYGMPTEIGRQLVGGLTDVGGAVGLGLEAAGRFVEEVGGKSDMNPVTGTEAMKIPGIDRILKPVAERLKATGEQVGNYWGDTGEQFKQSADIIGNVVDQPDLLANPKWWASNVARMGPGLAAAIMAGIATGGIAGPAIGTIGGGMAGGLMEGASTRRQGLQERGMTEDEATDAGVKMALASGILNAISLENMLNPSAKHALARFLISGSTEALTEAAEEPAEGVIFGEDWPEFTERLKNALTVMGPAFITGGIGGLPGGPGTDTGKKRTFSPEDVNLPPAERPRRTTQMGGQTIDVDTGEIVSDEPPAPAAKSKAPAPAAPSVKIGDTVTFKDGTVAEVTGRFLDRITGPQGIWILVDENGKEHHLRPDVLAAQTAQTTTTETTSQEPPAAIPPAAALTAQQGPALTMAKVYGITDEEGEFIKNKVAELGPAEAKTYYKGNSPVSKYAKALIKKMEEQPVNRTDRTEPASAVEETGPPAEAAPTPAPANKPVSIPDQPATPETPDEYGFIQRQRDDIDRKVQNMKSRVAALIYYRGDSPVAKYARTVIDRVYPERKPRVTDEKQQIIDEYISWSGELKKEGFTDDEINRVFAAPDGTRSLAVEEIRRSRIQDAEAKTPESISELVGETEITDEELAAALDEWDSIVAESEQPLAVQLPDEKRTEAARAEASVPSQETPGPETQAAEPVTGETKDDTRKKFIGNLDAGEIYEGVNNGVFVKLEITGNFKRKKDAISHAEKTGGKVIPYLSGKYKTGWVVHQPPTVEPVTAEAETKEPAEFKPSDLLSDRGAIIPLPKSVPKVGDAVSEDELSAIFDQAASEVEAKRAPLKTAAEELAAGMADIAKSIKIFTEGERGSISSRPEHIEFDQQRYAKLKEVWQSSFDHFAAAGRSIAEWMRTTIEEFAKVGILADTIKPYVLKFYQEQTQKRDAEHGTAKEKTVSSNASEKIAEWVKTTTAKRIPIASQALFDVADDAYGGTQAEGKYTPKDAFDALELGVNLRILDDLTVNVTTDNIESAKRSIAALKDFIALLPTQGAKRTEEMVQYQQFSTPPPLAYAVAWVANINHDDSVLEPSAGIGGIAVFAKNAEPKSVTVNELSKRRAEYLRSLDFSDIFTENAEQLHNILPERVKPTVVVMNPPFSSTAGRVSTNNTKNGARHIEQALYRLQPGGRLVAIVGRGMDDKAPSFRSWWRKIKGGYTVLANIGISGKEYTKYGTTFDNRILVIDKTGPTTAEPVTGYVEHIEDLIPLLKGVRDARQSVVREGGTAEQTNAVEPSGRKTSGEGTNERIDTDATVQPPTSKVGGGTRVSTGGRPDRVNVGGNVPMGPGVSSEGTVPEHGGENVSGRRGNNTPGKPRDDIGEQLGLLDDGERERETAVSPREQGADRIPSGTELQGGLKTQEAENTEQIETDSIYEKYSPSVTMQGARPHPTPLVESAAMSSVKAPKADYIPSLPATSISTGKVSDAQLEAVIRAGNAHSEMLPNGQRRGFFIGDGTGVGKGREIASIIWDNWNRGHKKAIWISESWSLINDAKRDIKGIGWGEGADRVFSAKSTKPGERVKNGSGIMFLTYDTLRWKFNNIREDTPSTLDDMQVRLNQIVAWLGKDYDGVIVFDEAHALKNSTQQMGGRGRREASQMAQAGVMLQNLIPKARIVYVSATGATEVANLAYCERLGLWGEGTAFSNKQQFINRISDGGLAAMELVARDMKAMGLYMSRSLSYDGVEYDRLTHELTPDQTKIYDELAHAWQIVLQNINKALEETQGPKGATYSQFWGAHQRFFNSVVTSMQMPSIIQRIQKDIADGNAIILQLTTTGEASQSRAIEKLKAEGGEYDDLDTTPRDNLIRFLEQSFPVEQYEEQEDADGNKRYVLVVDSEGNPVINQEAVEMRDRLIQELASIKIPDSPLEYILDQLGYENVAEITGRKRRVVMNRNEGKKVIQSRSEHSIHADLDDFLNDRKQILVFSEKGGTGASYHADRTFKNQRKRIHYLVQPGWKAETAIQGLGRSHRSNQAVTPMFVLVTTNLKAQMRFISTIARRLDQMGSLTRGQRQAGSQGIFRAQDNLESDYARDALRIFLTDLSRNRIDNLNPNDFEDQTGLKLRGQNNDLATIDIKQFLNRLLSLDVSMQNIVFDAFMERMNDVIEFHAQQGDLDVGMETITGENIKKASEKVVHTDKKTGAQTKYVQLDVTRSAENISFDEAKNLYPTDKPVFYRNIKSGRIWVASNPRDHTNEYGGVEQSRTLKGAPHGSTQKVSLHDLDEKGTWERVHEGAAQDLWDSEYNKLSPTVTERYHIMTGTLLPIWDRLAGRPTVYRMQTDNGERILGRWIHPDDLDATLGNLGVEADKIEISGNELAGRILHHGAQVRLANGWRIHRSTVSGDHRIEISGPDYYSNELLRKQGAFLETIQFKTRYFIPTNDTAGDILDRITEGHPIAKIEGGYSGPRLKDEKYSARAGETTPQSAGITLADVKAMFPKAAVTQESDGSFAVHIGNRRPLIIKSVQTITPDEFRFKVGYGRSMKPGERIAGKYHDGEITVSRHGDRWTIGHEQYHWLEEIGVITHGDRMALNGEIGRATGKHFTAVTEEDRAAFIEDQLKARSDERAKGIIPNIIQKVRDFIDGLVNLARRTARGVVRDIESGRMAERGAKKEYEKYNRDLQRYFDGAMKHHEHLDLGHPSDVLLDSYIPDEPIIIRKATLDHIIKDHANIPVREILGDLPKTMNDPVYIFKSKRHPGESKVIVINKIVNERPIVVAVRINQHQHSVVVNNIASLYDKDIRKIGGWVKEGLLQYKNSDGLTASGSNSLLKEAIKELNYIITGKTDSVKGESGSNIEDVPRYSVRKKPAPQKTVKAYKLFRRIKEKLYPLFVDAQTEVPMGVWLDAEPGPLTEEGKVKSKLGPLAYRPGWHAGDLPIARHIGSGGTPPTTRPNNQVWAEIKMADDRDWQTEANNRAKRTRDGEIIPRTAHITDQVPEDGYYRYKTNPNMIGNWLIGGSIKINRILSDDEVKKINDAAGVADLPREDESSAKYSARLSPDATREEAEADVERHLPAIMTDAARMVRDVFTKRGKNWSRDMKPDIGIIERNLSLLSHYAEKIPALFRAWEAAVRIPDYKMEFENAVFRSVDGGTKYLEVLDAFQGDKTNKLEVKLWKNYIYTRDRDEIGYQVRPAGPDHPGVYNLVGNNGNTVMSSEDPEALWVDAIRREAADAPFSPEGKRALVAYRIVSHNIYHMLRKGAEEAIKAIQKSGGEIPKVPAWRNGKQVEISLPAALALMGEKRGWYMPRIRKQGAYALIAKKQDEQPILEFFDTKSMLAIRAGQLERDGYTVTKDVSKRLSEDVYAAAGSAKAVQDMLQAAIDRMTKGPNRTLTIKDFGFSAKWDKTTLILTGMEKHDYISDILKEHGGNRHPMRGNQSQWVFKYMDTPKLEKLVRSLAEQGDILFDPDLLFSQMLVDEVANVVRERGARSHMIKRVGGRGKGVWMGYEQDPITAITLEGKGVAGAAAKHRAAKEMITAATGTDITWEQYRQKKGDGAKFSEYRKMVKNRGIDAQRQKGANEAFMKLFQDILRNDDRTDRVFGVIKGLAVLKYLSFRLAAPLVNLTALPTSAAASISGYTGSSLARAMGYLGEMAGQYTKFKTGRGVNAEDAALFEEIEKRGWHIAQFNREAITTLKNKFGRFWDGVMDVGMWLFGATEQINRAATIAAAYKAIKGKSKGPWTPEMHRNALTRAKQISDKAHAVYGKANAPEWARGTGLGANAARSMYVFRTFTHNYLLTMLDLAGGDANAKKAALWMATSGAILGGAAASVLFNVACRTLGLVAGDDPEEWLYRWIEDHLGDRAEMVARHGIPGLAGITIKGSLEIDLMNMPTSILDFLGAPGSIVTDVTEGFRYLTKGEIRKGFEKALPMGASRMIQAIREGTEGVTSRTNVPLFFGDEKVRLTPIETAWKFFSFTPSRTAMIREKQWAEKEREKHYSDKRTDIYARVRDYFNQPPAKRNRDKWAEILEDIREYNMRARKWGISPIRAQDIRGAARKTVRPPKKERLRGMVPAQMRQ